MRSKRRLSKSSGLCVIIDLGLVSLKKAVSVARSAVKAKAEMIQLRCKDVKTPEALKAALTLRKIVKGRSLFLVNDRAEVALASGADGLHIGKGDISAKLASRLMGKEKF